MPDSTEVFRRNLRELPAFRALLRAVEARFYKRLKMAEPTLDLGCGDGHFASTAFESALAVGMDSSHGLLQKDTKYSGSYRNLVQGEATRLPFAEQSFGSAMSNSVLEHIYESESLLLEVGRVLRPGAPFVFSVPSEYFRSFLSISAVLDKLGMCSIARWYERLFDRISRHYHYRSIAEWSELLEHSGFEVQWHKYYFSRRALRALEWWHYWGLPALVSKIITGRWILAPMDINMWLTDKLLRKYYEESAPARGAYAFIVARRCIE